jgi:hypothetical protein
MEMPKLTPGHSRLKKLERRSGDGVAWITLFECSYERK